jgi:hypothetical protein
MTTYGDFKAGLQNANDYLDATQYFGSGTGIDAGPLKMIASAEYSFTLRELICGLLSGSGFKLPNLQICMYANIQELLGLPNLQAALYAALDKLAGALQSFMDHTKIDDILGRLNAIIAEAQNVAAMINFCASPVNPIAIPNIIANAFGSFLGAGKSIIDQIGSIVPGQVCACLGTGGFNSSVFNGGILGTIANNFSAVSAGTLGQSVIDSITNDVNTVANAISSIISFENNILGSYDTGGSNFTSGGCNTEVGVMYNSGSGSNGTGSGGSITSTASVVSSLKSIYDNLASYPVTYQYNYNPATGGPLFSNTQTAVGQPITYPNIFHLLVEPEILDILDKDDDPNPNVSQQVPIYDYCGTITGYRTVYSQKQTEKSAGVTPIESTNPGFNGGDIVTSTPLTATSAVIQTDSVVGSDPYTKYSIKTVGATPVIVKFDEVELAPALNKIWSYTLEAVGSNNTRSELQKVKIEGIVQNNSGGYVLPVTPTKTYTFPTANGWDINTVIDSGQFKIYANGSSTADVTWSIKFSYIEL